MPRRVPKKVRVVKGARNEACGCDSPFCREKLDMMTQCNKSSFAAFVAKLSSLADAAHMRSDAKTFCELSTALARTFNIIQAITDLPFDAETTQIMNDIGARLDLPEGTYRCATCDPTPAVPAASAASAPTASEA